MRITDLVLVAAAAGAFVMAANSHDRVDVAVAAPSTETARKAERQLLTCPLRKPEFATIMQAALLGDGTLLVEQQTNTRVAHIKDC